MVKVMHLTSTIIYPKELCMNVEESHGIWFEFFQSDEAFFHCILAMAQAFTDLLQGGEGESIKVMRYLADTYRCINQKLKLEGTPDDATVAVVMSMTMHNNILRAPGGAKVHLNALQRMVELRGGLAAFSARLLVHKICRTDIEFSLQSGSLPRFYRDEFPHAIIRSSPQWPDTSYEAFITTTNAQIYNIEIQSVFRDLLSVSRFINMMGTTAQKLEPFMFQEILISVGYRLMHIFPLDRVTSLGATENACQLAFLAMVSTMLIKKSHSRLPYPFLAGLFHDAITRLDDNPMVDDNFLFWLLFMGAISVFEIKDEDWLRLKLRKSISKMELGSWQDVKNILGNYPWIIFFHDDPGLEVWEALIGS
ncbi:hypothetical protein TWF281_002403 [Arthrobotrys megalospora]